MIPYRMDGKYRSFLSTAIPQFSHTVPVTEWNQRQRIWSESHEARRFMPSDHFYSISFISFEPKEFRYSLDTGMMMSQGLKRFEAWITVDDSIRTTNTCDYNNQQPPPQQSKERPPLPPPTITHRSTKRNENQTKHHVCCHPTTESNP